MKHLSLAILASMAAHATANLVTNGSFEQPPIGTPFLTLPAGNPSLTGWTITGTSIDLATQVANPGYPARDGLQFVDLAGAPGPGKIEQSFATTVSQQYFYGWSGSSNGSSTQMEVFLNGPLLFTITTAPQGNWVDYGWTFTATTATTSIGFRSNNIGNQGALVDRVIVVPLPTIVGVLDLQDTFGTFAANRVIPYVVMQGTVTITSGSVTCPATLSPISIGVPTSATGPAQLIFNGSSFLQKTTNVTLGGLTVSVGTIACVNGDVDYSGEVDAADIDAVIADFGSTAVNDTDCDVSGEVDSDDIDIVVANFGLVDN
ncbi:MAG: DUF642 domain-containing protein [Chthonomonas sp.]|nr:DUF642 domain-containing protein [Chthonomonas sp.]